jgi:hypothetical protein
VALSIVLVAENSREKSVNQARGKVASNFLFLMNFLYIKREVHLESEVLK